MIYDSSVVVDGHVVWASLSAADQADLEANFPHQSLETDSAQFQAWLDIAYRQRTSVSIGVLEGEG